MAFRFLALLAIIILLSFCTRITKSINTVSKPTFSLPEGIYNSIQEVEIFCATEGAALRYTIDGTEPTEQSLEYSNPIIISKSITLKARAYKSDWKESDTAYAYYIIDDTSPEDMIFVQGGTFTPTENYTVTLSSFLIGKYEITQREYEKVMGANPSFFTGNPELPVESVSWFDAVEYCNRRSMMEGLTPCYSYLDYGTDPDDWPSDWNTGSNHDYISCNWSADGYRLPTEMEWKFASLGGVHSQGYTYSGSNDIDEVAWYHGNSYQVYGLRQTHPVGTKESNEIDTFDMSGNVWEWCWDRYGSYPIGNFTNPTGPISGTYRVRRGGSWKNFALICSVSSRYNYSPTSRGWVCGFRVARTYQ